MAKPKYTYEIVVMTICENRIGKKVYPSTTTTSIEVDSLDAVKVFLKGSLALAIRPGGEPYRPTAKDLINSPLGKYFTKDECKAQAKVNAKAFNAYQKILNKLEIDIESDETLDITIQVDESMWVRGMKIR